MLNKKEEAMISSTFAVGFVKNEPVFRKTKNGKTFCAFRLEAGAADSFQGVSEFNVVVWGNCAERLESDPPKNGSLVAVQGTVKLKEYQGKGEISLASMDCVILSAKSESATPGIEEDEIPF